LEEFAQSKFDRLAMILFALSILGNIALALLLERSSATVEALELEIKRTPILSPKSMQELTSGNPPVLGTADAPITVVMFSDFECPFCRQLAAEIKQLAPEQRRDLRLIFRQFPLPIHKMALQEAELTACAARQNNEAFWVLYDYFYDKPQSERNILDGAQKVLASQSKVDAQTLNTCIREHEASDTIRNDLKMGNSFGVRGTPTIFVNGRRFVGAQPSLSILLSNIGRQEQ
jgi:protein-disulfide isomerase